MLSLSKSDTTTSPGRFAPLWVASVVLISLLGCGEGGSTARLEKVWGRRGISDGRLQRPRAIAIDDQQRLYLVDMTSRIQVFDRDGKFLRGWRTPENTTGNPSGLSIDREGNLLVADTHYFRMLVYSPEGKLLKNKTIGGVWGHKPGEFGFVTDIVQDSHGNYYISEYGEYDRVQKFTKDGKFVFQWGSHGTGPKQFMRPQNMAIDKQDRIWIADACNHRIQIYDATGDEPRLVNSWGTVGNEPGQLKYPYDLVLDDDGYVYVVEFGNHRVQKFTSDGQSVACWGVGGRREGELQQPWALARDAKGRIHVVDTLNHRVQQITL